MVATPTDIPVTSPDEGLMVAMPVALLLHEPPAVASVKVIVPPTATEVGPAIGATPAVTVTVLVTKQPVPMP
jgi:hypothetical protein